MSKDIQIEESPYQVLIAGGKAAKLSPRSKGVVFYEVGYHTEQQHIAIRMTGNDGGGFHSKEWLTIDAIEVLIDDAKGKPFKSSQLKELFERSSANNTGFLCAVLKAESLIVSTENSQFLHVKSDKFKSGRERYLALVKKSKSATNKKK